MAKQGAAKDEKKGKAGRAAKAGKAKREGLPRPPKRYREFVADFPLLAEAWEKLWEAGRQGPLDERTCRLVKLAAAMGALREGAVRAGARKALAEGVTAAELAQLVALVAATVGMPAAVACYSWLDPDGKKS